MKPALQFVLIGLSCLVCACSDTYAQGRFNRTITFDGAPTIRPGSGVFVTYYYEDSMTFRPMNVGEQLSRSGGGVSFFPENGTAYILQAAFNTMAGSRGGISRFGLSSVDLSEFSILYAFPRTVQFIGYRADGTMVTTAFTTDGVIDGTGPLPDFQTFYFSEQFSDIIRFECPGNTYAMDNLVFFDVIPEPSVRALVVLGGGPLWLFGRRTITPNRPK